MFEYLQQDTPYLKRIMWPNQVNNLRKTHQLCSIRHSLCEHPVSYPLLVEASLITCHRTDTLSPSPQHQYQSPQTGQ